MKEEPLYFTSMGGMGTIFCKSCDFKEEIVSFLHSQEHVEKEWHESGYQCQSCGNFKAITNDDDIDNFASELCSCGGKLSRKLPLFCPKCKGRNLKYRLRIIT